MQIGGRGVFHHLTNYAPGAYPLQRKRFCIPGGEGGITLYCLVGCSKQASARPPALSNPPLTLFQVLIRLTAWLRQLKELPYPWRRGRDSNPRGGLLPPTGLANQPLQPLGYLSMSSILAFGGGGGMRLFALGLATANPNQRRFSSHHSGYQKPWRRGWDSNPRTLAGLRFSRPVH